MCKERTCVLFKAYKRARKTKKRYPSIIVSHEWHGCKACNNNKGKK